ncbi:hypothetical protein LHYA1_G000843 [Lachnellula hyalina]|uniref:DUF6594 domain-containing protein n=1 Tax=Lachnellula hyalina TaxID=1316788 RepID=A0A8H8RB16_9HELO|nr:uncharacterized protein LHYA1_G000843 [Lachnellula hyalina]TVY30888.1 hypothetical protein LHYA1_G000843 [Lachnellula hyalina]
MSSNYRAPTVAPIQEHSSEEDELKGAALKPRRRDAEPTSETLHHQYRSSHDSMMSPTKANTGKERERTKRLHKSSSGASKHDPKPKPKNISVRRRSSTRDSGPDGSRPRHRKSHSSRDRDRSPSSSSSEEEEPIQDHRAILAARSRLTSPSTLSTSTFLTTSTNKSGGSSGSNSTITQASISKRSSLVKKPEISEEETPEAPMSPAVPDAPDVFAFLEEEPSREDAKDGEGEDQDRTEIEEEDDADATPRWAPPGHFKDDYVGSSLPRHMSQDASTSSSVSSSFHGEDNFSEPPAEADHGNDTDRSTSPERSVHGEEDEEDEDARDEQETPPADETSAKVAAQIAAAHQRQNLHGAVHSFGTPNMQRGPANLPHVPSNALSSRYQYQGQHRPLPRAEKLPVTGYELLASQLSSHTDGKKIKPMYRKFEALNHRLLLHLQDEISELEEQLHRLDTADTQTRRTERQIMPASRRAAAAAGGELQWHKTDILGRIGYKLAQYNQALASFNTTQSLSSPDPDDISTYRDYLQTAHPIAEVETHFLDPADDLVSISSDHIPPSSSFYSTSESATSSYPPSSLVSPSKTSERSEVSEVSEFNSHAELQSTMLAYAAALAAAILIPILAFTVIPNFIGRIAVTSIAAGGVLGATIQGGVADMGMVLRSEGLMCAGIYGSLMLIVAGIMS